MWVDVFFSEHIFYLNYAVNGSEKLRANSKSVLSSSSGIQLNFSLPSFFLCSKFRTASQQSLSIKLYIVFHFFVLLSFFALILAWHSKKSPLFSVLKLHVLCCTVKMTFFIHPLSSQLSRAIINSIYFLHLYFNYSEQLTP